MVFVEHDDRVNTRKSGEHLGAFQLRIDRAIWTFDCPHGSIGVHTDDQRIALVSCILQIVHVARMQQIKHTVRKDDILAGMSKVIDKRDRFGEREHLAHYRPSRLRLMFGENVHVCFGR